MYIQRFVKGISAGGKNSPAFTWADAQNTILLGHGIYSNWWRRQTYISPREVQGVLTEQNLHRHVHDYAHFGDETPFISLASGCVERDALQHRNILYSAIDTALSFATDWGQDDGYLFYGWVPVSLNPAVEIGAVGEAIRDLNVYHRWSPFQLEGEITAKVHIPANQIETIEFWSGQNGSATLVASRSNPSFVEPTPILNHRELF